MARTCHCTTTLDLRVVQVFTNFAVFLDAIPIPLHVLTDIPVEVHVDSTPIMMFTIIDYLNLYLLLML